ncbi:MAG: hypothetical protein HYU53_17460 [Acidobacteria bacterium]|nr:hypothetical protein [Acidobacteriota bacterium]
MSHPLVLALYQSADGAALGARAARELGLPAQQLSVVARNIGATPGADIEDSRLAARFGELSAHLLAAMALVLPGVGPIVASGPLAAGMGEAAGHVAGDLSAILSGAGVSTDRADRYERAVEGGAILLGAHVGDATLVPRVCQALERSGGTEVTVADWKD